MSLGRQINPTMATNQQEQPQQPQQPSILTGTHLVTFELVDRSNHALLQGKAVTYDHALPQPLPIEFNTTDVLSIRPSKFPLTNYLDMLPHNRTVFTVETPTGVRRGYLAGFTHCCTAGARQIGTSIITIQFGPEERNPPHL